MAPSSGVPSSGASAAAVSTSRSNTVSVEEINQHVDEANGNRADRVEPNEAETVGGEDRPSRRCKLSKKQLLVLAVVVMVLLVAAVVLTVLLVLKDENDDDADKNNTIKDNDQYINDRNNTNNDNDKVLDFHKNSKSNEVCLTPRCLAVAAQIKQMLNQTVDPCENFYQFSCGSWLDNVTLLEDEHQLNVFTEIAKKVQKEIQTILEEPSSPNEEVPLTKMKTLYKSCVDTDTIDSRGDQQFRDWLEENISEWPIVSPQFNPDSIDLTQLCVNLTKYGLPSLFDFKPDADLGDSRKYTLYMDQMKLSMQRDYYFDETTLQHQLAIIYLTAQAFSLHNSTKAMEDAVAVIKFEQALAMIVVKDEERRDFSALYNPMTLAEFNSAFGSDELNFETIVKKTMASFGVNDITDDELIININPQYFQKLKQILEAQEKSTVVNYLVWRAVKDLNDALPKKYRDLYTIVGASRSATCLSYVDKSMGLAITKQFTQNYLDPDANTEISLMLKELRAAFTELLGETKWMDNKSKRLAKEKVQAMKTKIAFPEFVKNTTMIAEMYKDYTFSSVNFLENKLKLSNMQASQTFGSLQEPIRDTTWQHIKSVATPQSVNALYIPQINEIVIPAGILQPPIFSTEYPRYLTYGGFGSFIGHEITHGFDDQGRQFDKNGNIRKWWSNYTIENFKEKTNCLIEQYGSYRMDEVNMTINGIFTQGENIADNGGLRESYMAYRDWVARNGKEEPTLPGLEYTVDQLFFISWGQIWCSKETPAMTSLLLIADNHSPARYRTIGPPRNFDQFSKTFNCSRSSYMNPKEKCRVW